MVTAMSQPDTSVCRYPDIAPLTGYKYGCRCERCTTAMRKAWAASNAKRPDRDRSNHATCPGCGGRKGADRKAVLCRKCASECDRARRDERCRQISAWWADGLSMNEICTRLGWVRGSLSREMDWMRHNGHSLPHRYKTYAGKARA